MKDTKDIRNSLERLKGRRDQIKRSLNDIKNEYREAVQSHRKHEEAREIIREVGLKTQQTLQVHISDITTLALEAVFPNPYELQVEFVQRRNKTECDLLFVRDGEAVDPLEATGGGAVDVASFALRIASWSMQRPKSRNTIILDEPMRFLSEDLQEHASQMLKELSEKLGIQFIIITHNDTLAKYADKLFRVSYHKGVSNIIKE